MGDYTNSLVLFTLLNAEISLALLLAGLASPLESRRNKGLPPGHRQWMPSLYSQ